MPLMERVRNFFGTRTDVTMRDAFKAQGGGATTVFGQLPRNHERNPRLATIKSRMELYAEISKNTGVIATALRYFGALITSINWSARAALDQPGDKTKEPTDPKFVDSSSADAMKYAWLVERNMFAMDEQWHVVVRRAGEATWLGFSIQEMIAARMDDIQPGYIGIGAVENRPQATIEEWYTEPKSGWVTGWKQRDPETSTAYELTRDKCIYNVDDMLTNSPDGMGLLRHVVQLVEQLRKLEALEIQAFETDLRGIPVATMPMALLDEMVARGQITETQKAEKLAGIRMYLDNHFRNERMGLELDSSVYTGRGADRSPSSNRLWGMELMRGDGSGIAELSTAIIRKQMEIARALGAEQFMLGASEKGSHALSEDKTRNLLEIVNSAITQIGWILNRDYVRFVGDINRWPLGQRPTIQPDAASLRSVSVIVEVISKLALAGATVDRNDPIINQIRGMLKLVPQPFVTPEMQQATKPPNSGGTPGEKAPNKPSPSTGKDS